MRGTRAALVIRQTAEEAFVPTLYVEDSAGRGTNAVGVALRKAVSRLCSTWPGIEVEEVRNPKLEIRKKSETRNSNQPRAVWKILVPEKYHVGHEAHFAQVTEKYLQYLADGKLADWEVPNMLAKYYTTTEAFRLGHTRQTAP
jgi:hypothetical protein